MGYGQYSAGGGISRRKPELLAIAEVDGAVASSKLAGKNRLHFTRPDGSQGFILHQTIIATLSADKATLTLGDGGWHTLTTKAAWHDACAAFGFVKHYPAAPELDTPARVTPTAPRCFPSRDERVATYRVTYGAEATTFERFKTEADFPMLRADVEAGYGGNFAVRFTGTEIVSEAGARHRCTPFRLLTVLLRIDQLAREAKDYRAPRGNDLGQFFFEAFGYTIHPGQSAASMMVGCHTFKTMDFRALLRRVGVDHPEELAKAKRFHRRHPVDFGVKAFEAARVADRQARGFV